MCLEELTDGQQVCGDADAVGDEEHLVEPVERLSASVRAVNDRLQRPVRGEDVAAEAMVALDQQ